MTSHLSFLARDNILLTPLLSLLRYHCNQVHYLGDNGPDYNDNKNRILIWQHFFYTIIGIHSFLNPLKDKISNAFFALVVAGVASLSGEISVAVRNSLLLECKSVGSPPPRTVWYHNQNIITHHPRFTRNRDDSLLIKS